MPCLATPSSWMMTRCKDEILSQNKTGHIIHVNGAVSTRIGTSAASFLLVHFTQRLQEDLLLQSRCCTLALPEQAQNRTSQHIPLCSAHLSWRPGSASPSPLARAGFGNASSASPSTQTAEIHGRHARRPWSRRAQPSDPFAWSLLQRGTIRRRRLKLRARALFHQSIYCHFAKITRDRSNASLPCRRYRSFIMVWLFEVFFWVCAIKCLVLSCVQNLRPSLHTSVNASWIFVRR